MTTMHSRGLALALVSAATVAGEDAIAEGPAPRENATVTAVVSPLRNQKGALGCRLYKSGAGFPETSAGAVELRVAASSPLARCVFSDVPPGTYALSVMHDENDNRKLDKNFLGIPTEGYGVSNNHTHAMSAPTWEESKFVVERGRDVSLAIRLRY